MADRYKIDRMNYSDGRRYQLCWFGFTYEPWSVRVVFVPHPDQRTWFRGLRRRCAAQQLWKWRRQADVLNKRLARLDKRWSRMDCCSEESSNAGS